MEENKVVKECSCVGSVGSVVDSVVDSLVL